MPKDPDKKWYTIPGLTDKQMHAVCGGVIFFLSNLLLSWLVAYAIVLIAALTKEFYDYYHGRPFDVKDIIATLAGAIIIHPLKIFLWHD